MSIILDIVCEFGEIDYAHISSSQMAAFNMGSTVVLIFQAPMSESHEDDDPSGFRFCIKQGDRIRVGQALGRWNDQHADASP